MRQEVGLPCAGEDTTVWLRLLRVWAARGRVLRLGGGGGYETLRLPGTGADRGGCRRGHD